MINLTQDADGFIRMNRHFPANSLISIAFTDGSTGEFSGHRLNAIFDDSLAVFRASNHLDAKGFSRAPAKTVHPSKNIQFVPVQAGMTN